MTTTLPGIAQDRPKPENQHGWWIDKNTREEKTYTWTDAQGTTHTSKITEKAEDVDQMFALLAAVYTDPEVPGQNYHDEYLSDGTACEYQITPRYINYEEHAHRNLIYWGSSNNPVNMNPGIYSRPDMFFTRQGGVADAPNWRSTYKTASKYGWSAADRIYAPWIPSELYGNIQNPVEGMTLILVEIKESWDQSQYVQSQDRAVDPREFVSKSIKSMQVITESLRIDDAANDKNNPGYLFVIREISANRFYFLSKGRARAADFFSSPTYTAFEIISPRFTAIDSERLRGGNVERVEHDCYSVFQRGSSNAHYVVVDGGEEATVISNLSLFMPDKRFAGVKYDPVTNTVSQTFDDWVPGGQYLYQPNAEKYRPGMLLYKAFLTATATPSSTVNYYDINLNWRTYFDAEKLQTSVGQQFYVYILNETTGEFVNLTTVPEANIGETTLLKNWTYPWPQREHAQKFTYYVSASPFETDENGNIVPSDIMVNTNTATVIIPGTQELFINDASDHRSRFALDQENVEFNVYRNRPLLTLTSDDVNTHSSVTYDFFRTHVDENSATQDEKIADIRFTAYGIRAYYNDAMVFDDFMQWTKDGKLISTKTVRNGYWFHLINPDGTHLGWQDQVNDGNRYWAVQSTIVEHTPIQLTAINDHSIKIDKLDLPEGAEVKVTFVFDPATNQLRLYYNADDAGVTSTGDIYTYTVNYVPETQKLGTGAAADGDVLYSDDTSTDLTYTGTVNVGGTIPMIDRFTASTETNSHPDNYSYQLRIGSYAASNTYDVPIMKSSTEVRFAGFLPEQVDGDLTRELREGRQLKIDFDVIMDRERNLEKYNVHRVHGNDYHTHVGKAERTNGDNLYLLGIDHATGKVTVELGAYPLESYFNGRSLRVWDDSDYCPDDNPEYVTEIFVGTRSYDGEHVQNTYGTNVAKVGVPQLTFTGEALLKSKSFAGKTSQKMGYKVGLKLTPDLTKMTTEDKSVYYYRIWRVNDDGSETLLNSMENDGEYGATFSKLKDKWPGGVSGNTNMVEVIDAFIADPVPAAETEEVYDVNTGETVLVKRGGKKEINYIARMYSTTEPIPSQDPSQTPRSAAGEGGIWPEEGADHDYYVTEKKVTVTFDADVATGIDMDRLAIDKEVVATRYYNLQGMEAEKPFDGVNIVVTTYADGTTSTVKQYVR